MYVRNIQLELQSPALFKLMEIYTIESIKEYKAYRIFVIAIPAICLVGVAYGTLTLTPYVIAPLILGAIVTSSIKVMNNLELDGARWRPICEALLDAKFDEAFDQLDKLPNGSMLTIHANRNHLLYDAKVIAIKAYILKELFNNEGDSFDTVKNRIIEKLDKFTETEAITKQDFINFVKNRDDFPQNKLTSVASRIHLILFNLIFFIKKSSEKEYGGSICSHWNSALWDFSDRTENPLTDFEDGLFKSIENCSTFADKQKVVQKVTDEQQEAILSKIWTPAKA